LRMLIKVAEIKLKSILSSSGISNNPPFDYEIYGVVMRLNSRIHNATLRSVSP
jgi:hypothetical protein